MYSVDTIVLSFFIYSLLGWVCEVVYCSIPKRRFVNRGFLYGPYLPIYGTGATLVVVLMQPVIGSWPLVFILSLLLTSALEYITSFLLEKLFHVKLWDYSSYPLNINGRVCALNSTLFGLLSLFIVYIVNTPIQRFLFGLDETMVDILSLLIVAIMSADAAVTVVRMTAFQKAMKDLSLAKEEAEARLHLVLDQLSPSALELVKGRLAHEIEERKERWYRSAKHFIASNPSLTVRRDDLRKQWELAKASYDEIVARRRSERKARRKDK